MITGSQRNLRYVHMLLYMFKDQSSSYIRLLFAISGLFVCKILNQESLMLLKMMMMIPNLSCSAHSPKGKMNLVMDLNQTRDILNGLV
jgi:hypothetical protein